MGLALIVDDDADAADMLAALCSAEGYHAATAHTLEAARKKMVLQPPDVVLLDLHLPDGNGLSFMNEQSLRSNTQVVLVTGHATLETSIQALRLGAADYLVKPVSLPQLRGVLSRVMPPAAIAAEIESWRKTVDDTGRFGHLVGRSACMRRVYEQIARVAGTSVTVFVTGDSGTGKELVARTVHDLSRRRSQPFLAINCGAISPQLMESEIFGHEKGSFTGAERQHQGFFERAHGGTLFLDEVTEMPMELQVKLLRVLETGTFMRVGSTVERATDVRIVAATNRDPLSAVAGGALREDLFYRLNVFPIELPPLRERAEDIGLLSTHFLAAIGQKEGRPKRLEPEALERLERYRWPGNVRELRNVMQRAYVMAEGDAITAQWLPTNGADADAPAVPEARAARVPVVEDDGAESAGQLRVDVGTSIADVEQQLILRTLRHFDNHKERAAAALGVSLKTLYNKLKAYESTAADSSSTR
ncbi:sigma-54-dependent Fis family transcriptional regulator [Paracidovorax avenae]|uniref:sigma-54-dependent transcriptional regulator n=1 Tax=Paracidovorax avenae TaxID=80867 RepID=UPI000D15B266|nr:sigma-54 dependent transcriptional regulator [Paracidovorax avenae]AVS94126.1 sigma-54-dependent Fis family transcriptional regulator [Paracidovorax avenae]AVS99706.1 sigma-54-dependent Fis family transcriptional regulator [Paracidovorax avenae]AVT06761.1 sigma-54-dependent Fis family transcriptional regulator [Paracidovorax avenae]AVT21126.1 sigma-54-dependent Fis family transcriptional regulator [Paracidovorax avenae]